MGEEVGDDEQQRAVDAQVLPVGALAERLEEAGGCPGPRGMPSVSVGCS